ncbi:RNA 2'-phosphotransferase [Flavobacterium pectinovorum]|uniref:Probable RNA 2'-phosphotransferase n=1 Tax=Flavobacterium pectinovorum TaxID=29533 RepID=A0A502E925_9FLAO|nr:RNA 2'-phosphotransferase [Flavobacterium pectinovorum]TPG33392.1 RNA 2'-phosphotransferase [Flavobacterium pectinovorum]
MNEKIAKSVSKFLSLVLRHSPETIELKLDENGWADVEELIEKCNKKGSQNQMTVELLDYVVENNDKKRFAFNEDKTKIRASQGHSISVELNLDEAEPSEFLYHGTVGKFLDSIKKEGLQKMSRQYVHLSKDLETAIKVGSRRGSAQILTVRSGEMHRDGFKFYLSENNVWLTDNVPAKYIQF